MNIEDTRMCIYQIIHWESGNSYVGQTTERVGKRWNAHCKSYSGSTKLKNAIQKYGRDAFEFTVLEECETVEQLNVREDFWIAELKTLSPNGHNLYSGGNTNKRASEETKRKLSATRKGIVFSEETLKKMSDAAKIKIITPETRKKMGDCLRGRKRTPEDIEKMKIGRIKAKLRRLENG